MERTPLAWRVGVSPLPIRGVHGGRRCARGRVLTLPGAGRFTVDSLVSYVYVPAFAPRAAARFW